MLPPTSTQIQYVVREPYMPNGTRYKLTKGLIESDEQLLITSKTHGGRLYVATHNGNVYALALRTGASIFASEEILDEAGVAIPDEQEDEVEKFREFLDTISPEDFGRAT